MININDLYQHTTPESINAVIQNDEEIAKRAISNAYSFVKAIASKYLQGLKTEDIDKDEILQLAVIKRALYELFIYSSDVIVAEQFKNDCNTLLKSRFTSSISDKDKEQGEVYVYIKEGSDNWNGFK